MVNEKVKKNVNYDVLACGCYIDCEASIEAVILQLLNNAIRLAGL